MPERACSWPALAGLVAFAGCSMIPSYERPAAPVPDTYPLETDPASPPAEPAGGRDRWQRFFADPRLQRLIDLALANNRDLRVAVLNIEQARRFYDVRRADEWPTLGIGGSARARATSQGSIGTCLHRRRRGQPPTSSISSAASAP
jgi:multidrug efflux system outer membrane protein